MLPVQKRPRGGRHYCSACAKSFSKKEHLTRHIRSHTREQPFPCQFCGKRFGRNDTLTRHTRSHHPSQIHPLAQVPGTHKSSPGEVSQDCLQSAASYVLQAGHPAEQNVSRRSSYASGPDTTQLDSLPPSAPEMTAPLALETVSLSDMSSADHDASPFPLQPVHPPDSREMGRIKDDVFSDYYFCSDPSTWLNARDFNLELDSANLNATFSFSPDHLQQDLGGRNEVNIIDDLHHPPTTIISHKEDLVRRQWFTFVDPVDTGDVTPEIETEQTRIDESFREDLHKRLCRLPPSTPLPSADFLNHCLRSYFTRFHPIFPILHVPSFRLSRNNTLLLMSICTVGSLFSGFPRAAVLGQKIFDRLNKAALASWEKYVSRGPQTALVIIQAALIGHTYAMLSGQPSNLLTMQSFHGTIITWAKTCRLFNQNLGPPSLGDGGDQDLEGSWRLWIQNQEQARAVAALHIHDTEYCTLLNVEPLLRHIACQILYISPRRSWEAATAQEWQESLKNEPTDLTDVRRTPSSGQTFLYPMLAEEHGLNSFGIYCRLENISGSISAAKMLGSWPASSAHAEMSLLEFHDTYLRHSIDDATAADDPYSLEILWHSAFILMSADLNRLELALGRQGYMESQLHLDHAKSWARSRNGARCAAHGALILRKSEVVPLGSNVAIHVPRVLYWAALVWYCFLEFARDQSTQLAYEDLRFEEFNRLGIRIPDLLLGEEWALDNFKKICFVDDFSGSQGWESGMKRGYE
ncbi:uncharacterized protein N7458_003690 [Penicillium daleae]|uniref:C2H2-type domain-containing protein n=1 Tax=Penicillium daleae TaxID=63821 RepID=A0AAD6CCF2_9EURO|nr:uncharacterized protein N7458_003690 [Penicillium daleae]KAJ5456107.1 hypothetical protein N7458_003690 [Penicillium daleae]